MATETPTPDQREERTAHWGTCSNCDCSMLIYPHSERPDDLPDDEDWDQPLFFMNCPVCGESMDWGGSDHPADILKSY